MLMIAEMEFSFFENILFWAFLVFVVVYILVKGHQSARMHISGAVIRVRAKLISKYTEQCQTRTAYQSNGEGHIGVVEQHTIYRVMFEIQNADKEQIDLEVPYKVYENLNEGDTKELSYMGKQFIQFGRIADYHARHSGGSFVTMGKDKFNSEKL